MTWYISALFCLMGKPCLILRIKSNKIDVAPGTYNVTCITHAWIMVSWWRHQMETFSPLLALCVGNSPVSGEFPSQSPVTRSFDVFCDLRQNKRLSKQSWGWWFETTSHPLWRHCDLEVYRHFLIQFLHTALVPISAWFAPSRQRQV